MNTWRRRTWRRRNFFIKKELQGKYIFSVFIFMLAGAVLFTTVFGLLSADTLTITYKGSNLQVGRTPIVLVKEIVKTNWIFIVAGGLLVVIASIFLTHRVAGPLYRFERTLEEMKKGNFNSEIRLRSKDEAKEVARMFNEFNANISLQLKEIQELTEALGGHLTDARSSAPGAALDESLDKALEVETKLRGILHGFTLKNDN
jgi:methyl-accepting chemotaxis protein